MEIVVNAMTWGLPMLLDANPGLPLLLDENPVLTPTQLRSEAMAIQTCLVNASRSFVIDSLVNLIQLWAGGDIRDSRRVDAWISGTEQDKNIFIDTANNILYKLCTSFSYTGILSEATKKAKVKEFIDISYIKSLTRMVTTKFENVLEYGTVIQPFLENINVCVFKMTDEIISFMPVEEMRKYCTSYDDEYDLQESAISHYNHILHTTGEVTKFLITADVGCGRTWKNLRGKVDRTRNIEYLFSRATSLTCSCGRSIEPRLVCAILDNCYDLLCAQCARKTWSNLNEERKCPICTAPTKYWMSSTVFEMLKTRMKKRKFQDYD